jgi:pentatricopeptide repeat protein
VSIAGFAENNLMDDALTLFSSMLKGQTKPKYTILANILPVRGSLDENIASWFGKEIHGYGLGPVMKWNWTAL